MLSFWLSRIVCNVLSNLYPAYASYKAVLSGDDEQHRQWLSYWVVITIFTVFELFGDRLISWLPLYYESKIVLVIWLTLPPWRGASVLYNTVIAKHLEALEPDIDHFAASAQQRATVAWADLQHRIASLVTRHAKELLGAAATALASAAATTQRRQIEPATLVDDDGDIDERDTAPRGTAKGQRKVR